MGQNGVFGGEMLSTAGIEVQPYLRPAVIIRVHRGGVRRINHLLPRLSVISYQWVDWLLNHTPSSSLRVCLQERKLF